MKKNPIYIVLDNVLDTYNIGAVFRLADAVAAERVILCAGSETPPNHRIKKASINTTEWVDWKYYQTAKEAIEDLRLKIKGLQVIVVEQDARSIPYDNVNYSFPAAIVVGHETDGVSKEVLDMARSRNSLSCNLRSPRNIATTLCWGSSRCTRSISALTAALVTSKEVLDMADHIVELPMWGVNISLNVMVSLGIVLYEVTKHLPQE